MSLTVVKSYILADQLKASTGTQNPAMSPQSVQPAPGPFDMGWKTADVSVKSKKGKSRATEGGPTSENAEEQRKEALVCNLSL